MRFKKNKLNMFIDTVNVFACKKLINVLIKKGKKEKALKIFLYLLREIKKKIKTEKKIQLFNYLQKSFNNMYPEVDMKRMKRGRKFFYLPKTINEQKKIKIIVS